MSLPTLTAADFDAASAAWMANKIRRGASVAYRCQAVCKTGKPCTRAAVSRYAPDPVHLCQNHLRYAPPSKTVTYEYTPSASSSDRA